ncbi:unnamed protein product [Trypanosoma congolense IL3000]|uniref:WGS project CAEQ00000000 data, annotated contig 1113 n=1 Tax=Trypanosoma congolense (strain IL3000) TaxID=1068625 RepID=F9W3U6_TRYCI|nr:unnamed protein product [Trypanosoma congolense IL3000]
MKKEDAGNNSEAQVKPTVTREAALAQLSLNQITQKAHTIWDEIKKMEITENIEKAKAEFAQVIFGDNGNESDLCNATVKGVGNRSKACGHTGLSSKGSSAGKNLVVDFFCLCVRRQDGEGVNQVCGFYAGSGYKNGQLGWNETGPWGSSTMWALIKGGCWKHMQQHPKSTSEARHILDKFLKHLKVGGVYRQIKCENDPPCSNRKAKTVVSGSDRKAGMLGTAITVSISTEVTCDGKKGDEKTGKNPGGVCVYYGQESEWKNIPWVIKFETALASVDAVNNQKTSIQRAIQKLQMLLHRAEEIYETTKVISEIKYHGGLTAALQNASGNLTVYNTTRIRSYSYNLNSYFVPAWALLFL